MSKVRDCKYCHRRISIRQMPYGQWVAFDVPENTPHDCDQSTAPTAAKPAQDLPVRDRADWRASRRQTVLTALRGLPFASLGTFDPVVSTRSAAQLALGWADDLVARLGIPGTLGSVPGMASSDADTAQELLHDVVPDETVSLSNGLATGPVMLTDGMTIEGEVRDGLQFWSGNGPAIVIDAGDSDVTLRRMTVNADSTRGTILLRSGSLRLEDCLVSGRIGIMVAEGAGPLTVTGSRIVCPEAGCGIVAGPGTNVTVAQVWIGSHRGIGILGLAASEIEYDDYRFVGDDGIELHSQDI